MNTDYFTNMYSRVVDKAHLLGIPKEKLFSDFPWIEQYQHGSGILSISKSGDLADYLHLSPAALLEGKEDPFVPQMGARMVYMPSIKKYLPKDWESVQKVLDFPISLYRELGENITPSFYEEKDVSEIILDQKTAIPYGAAIRELFLEHSGENYLLKLPTLIEEIFGIDVFILNNGLEFDAYSGKVMNKGFIIVQANRTWYRVIFSILHELGHILHGELEFFDDPYSEKTDDIEKWMNTFASNVIFPPLEEIKSIDWASMSEEDFVNFIWKTNISSTTLLTHLRKNGIDKEHLEVYDYSKQYDSSEESESTDPTPLEKFIGVDKVEERKETYNSQRVPQWILQEHLELYSSGKNYGFGLAKIYNKSIVEL